MMSASPTVITRVGYIHNNGICDHERGCMGRNSNDDDMQWHKDVTKGGANGNDNDNELHNQYNKINEGKGEGKRYHPGLVSILLFTRYANIYCTLYNHCGTYIFIDIIYS